jgi:putative membrane protein
MNSIPNGITITRKIFLLSGIALLSGTLALAQQQPMGGTPQPSTPANPANNNPNSNMNGADQMQRQQDNAEGAMQDRAFVQDALKGGMAEVQLGQLAAQKGSSPDVKQFGQKMVDDHTKLGDEMKQVARQMGIREPRGLSKKDEELVAKLQSLSGAQFDDAYIKAMVKDHRKDSSDFQQEAQNTQNPALKQVTQQGGQVIDQHLQMIEQIAKTHGVKS